MRRTIAGKSKAPVYAATPTIQAYNITFNSITSVRIGLRWTKGNGALRLILASPTPILVDETYPMQGIDYTANPIYGIGDLINNSYCVYRGNGSTILVTGLSPSTLYYFKVFEFGGSGALASYLVDDATNNPMSRSTS